HVKQSPWIWFLLAYWKRPKGRVIAIPGVIIQIPFILTKVKESFSTSAARILPFSLCWETNRFASSYKLRIEFFNKLLTVVPAYVFNRILRAFDLTWVVFHCGRPLLLGDFRSA